MMEIRFNILNKYVEKFVVVESRFSHSGKEKKLNFDINKYEKFKDKIIYLVIDDEPKNLIEIKNDTRYCFRGCRVYCRGRFGYAKYCQ